MIIVTKLIEDGHIFLSDDKSNKAIAEALASQSTIVTDSVIYEYSVALNVFIKKWGGRWRTVLREAWFDGGYPNSTPREHIHALQQLRNRLGGI